MPDWKRKGAKHSLFMLDSERLLNAFLKILSFLFLAPNCLNVKISLWACQDDFIEIAQLHKSHIFTLHYMSFS